MNFKKWVKSLQTAGYNGACTVLKILDFEMPRPCRYPVLYQIKVFLRYADFTWIFEVSSRILCWFNMDFLLNLYRFYANLFHPDFTEFMQCSFRMNGFFLYTYMNVGFWTFSKLIRESEGKIVFYQNQMVMAE